MKNRIVPYSEMYKKVGTLNQYATILLYTSTIVSIGISALSYNSLEPDLQTFLIITNSLLISLTMYLDNRAGYIFTRAEMRRRLDWLDNSFETNFSGKKSQDYFTNEHLSPGLYKLSVNCFENSFHTDFIVSKMLPKIIMQTIIIGLCFIISSYFGNREILRLFFELLLPALLIQKLIKAIFYASRISSVLDRFKSLFSDLMSHDFNNKTAEALRDILEYETTLAWASIPLSSKVFWKNRKQLASEWDELKNNYKVSNLNL